MSTISLRRDHDLIEKVIKSMETTIQLLESGKKIPEPILLPVIDFSKNFTDVCHHSKEEKSLFPALERSGMPTHMGPITMTLLDNKKEFPDWDSYYKENNVEKMPWYEKNLDPDLEYEKNQPT